MSDVSSKPLTYQAGDQPVPGYTLVRELGRGAMGVVWLARTERGFERALKVINLQERGGRKEYRGLRTVKQRKLLHGNLLTLIDYWLKDADGQFVEDTDELGSADSFFMLPSSPRAGGPAGPPSSLAATAPALGSTTDVQQRPAPAPAGVQPSAATAVGAPQRGAAATLVARGTLDESALRGGPPATPAAPTGPHRRPVQLLVAMELGHQTLDDRQKQCRRDRLPGIPVEELLAYMEQAARGLDYLHREGIIHRDVKPQNIMLVGDVAKVCDYGLVVAADADLRMTSNAFTPLYASPEAVAGKPVTGQSDQYSLAITYVELRTGRTPYPSETAAAVFAAKESGKYDLSRIRNRRVRAVLRRALSPLPQQRYESCTAFVRELQAAERARSRLPLVLGGVLLAIAVASFLAWPTVRQSQAWRTLLASLGSNGSPTTPTNPRTPTTDLASSSPRGDAAETSDSLETSGSGSGSGTTQGQAQTLARPDVAQAVERARALRLASNLDAAAQELQQVEASAHASDPATTLTFRLARLHLDVARHLPDFSRVPDEQRRQWHAELAELGPMLQKLSLPAHAPPRVEHAALVVLTGAMPLSSGASIDDAVPSAWGDLFAARASWNTLLTSQQQQRLMALRAELTDTLTKATGRWPTAWMAQLDRIYDPAELADLFASRMQRLELTDAAAREAVASDLEELAARGAWASDQEALARLAPLRTRLAQLRTEHLLRQLAPLATADLSQPDVRQQLDTLLRPLGERVPPLGRLLQLEAALEQGEPDRGSLQAWRDECQRLIDQLAVAEMPVARSGSPSDLVLPLAYWVMARLDRALGQPLRGESLKSILAWPVEPADRAPWQTARRSQLAAQWLVEMADAALVLEAADALRFRRVPIEESSLAQASDWLARAGRLSGPTPDTLALGALVEALRISRQQPPASAEAWKQVRELAEAALQPTEARKTVAQRREPLVRYVAALSAGRLGGTGRAAQDQQAVATLAGLLRQGGWRDDAPASRRADEDWLVNVVLPGLAIPAPPSPSGELAADLALLWAAQGRILERNGPSLLRVEGIAPVPHDDPRTSCLWTAHAAYRRAWQLDPRPVYAAGVGRTLLKLPRGELDEAEHLPLLEEIVQRCDPSTTGEVGLLLAGGWLARKRAYAEADRTVRSRLVQEALQYFDRLDQATRASDVYAVRSVALCNASDTCLRAAFWTPIVQADEAAMPREGSKYALLQQALAWGRAAQTDPERDLPEEAFIAEGNALEDLAYYYKLTEHYEQACQAFQQAVEAAGRQRSGYALMSLGRCRYRWAVDAAILEGDLPRHHQELRQAHEAIAAALGQLRATQWSFRAETLAWRGYLLREAAEQGPGDPAAGSGERADFLNDPLGRLALQRRDPARKAAADEELRRRLELLQQAWRDLTTAAQTVQPHDPSQWAVYLSDALEIGAGLAGRLRDLASPQTTDLSAEAVWRQLQTDAQTLLEYAKTDVAPLAASRARTALRVLAAATSALAPASSAKAAASELLRQWTPLFKSRSGAAWQAEYATVLLMLAEYEDAPAAAAAAIAATRQAVRDVEDATARHLVLGHCLRLEADSRRRAMADKLRSLNSAAPQLSAADDPVLAALEDLYAQALDELVQTADPRTQENLKRLVDTPLEQIESGVFDSTLSLLEKTRLRMLIQSTFGPAAPLRQNWYQILDARMWLHRSDWKLRTENAPLPAEAHTTARRVLACLKPILLVDKRADLDRPLLRLLEKKLGEP